jgi:lysophospholipase L1-like esterase
LLQQGYRIASKVEVHEHLQPAAGSKILIIGDSNGDFAGGGEYSPVAINTLQVACKGSTVSNQAVGGTYIGWWLANNATQLKTRINSQTGWTHVWLTIGGNDLSIAHQCGPGGSGKNAFKGNLTLMISKIKALTSAQIVLTGYAVSGADDVCSLVEMQQNVDAGMQEVAQADPRVTFASMAPAAGGLISPTARAAANCYNGLLTKEMTNPQLTALIGVPPCRGNSSLFHPDLIHLKPEGYARAWALPPIQTAFGCKTSPPPPASNGTAAPNPTAPPPPPTAAPNASAPPPPALNGTAAPIASKPPPPPASNATAAPNATACTDDNAGIMNYAAGLGHTVTGCAGVAEFCSDATYGVTVQSYCKTTCKVGACR